ncbi:hypothetical protein BLNAU_11408 [Blattamonas nauphoetae]|uniref:Uncharacterized protein n=1 Tax=Blattamonas nauphoetae TaxID=2049346 RepID=A0ABQ9XQL3_9EUKA|nr:hypothetical protein BLNAU_19312 [Blattamonas nauphoetae]KAK2953687.1 hypothetical protein BLNAU_11408 [Blattamonas nauphoetae]
MPSLARGKQSLDPRNRESSFGGGLSTLSFRKGEQLKTEKSVRSVLNPARAQFSVEVPFCSTVTPSCEPARILLLAA